MKRQETDAERAVKNHGGVYTHGGWDRASGLSEQSARACAAELADLNYQVRSVAVTKDGKWEVIFR